MSDVDQRLIEAGEARDLYQQDVPHTVGEWTYVTKQHERTSRWHECYWMVLRHDDGTFWGVPYREGLTESQESVLPWDDYHFYMQKPRGSIIMQRLHPREIIQIEYSPVAF